MAQKGSSDLIRYITERKWTVDKKSERRRYLCRLARQSRTDPDIAGKIGGMLIYNQVLEQLLKDIVEESLYYIKAEIWPVKVELDPDLESATFGKVIDYFRQYATVEENRDQILSDLKKYNTKRNQVVHDLFDIHDLKRLGHELDDYAYLADEIIQLLEEYDRQVSDNFAQLEKKPEFRKFLKT